MKRITVILFLILLFVVAAVSFNCGQRDEVRSEAYIALAAMNKTAVSNFDIEIAKIDQQLRDNQVSKVKLDQVVVPAQKWVEDKKVTTDINSIPCG
jgi:hypothetical protein